MPTLPPVLQRNLEMDSYFDFFKFSETLFKDVEAMHQSNGTSMVAEIMVAEGCDTLRKKGFFKQCNLRELMELFNAIQTLEPPTVGRELRLMKQLPNENAEAMVSIITPDGLFQMDDKEEYQRILSAKFMNTNPVQSPTLLKRAISAEKPITIDAEKPITIDAETIFEPDIEVEWLAERVFERVGQYPLHCKGYQDRTYWHATAQMVLIELVYEETIERASTICRDYLAKPPPSSDNEMTINGIRQLIETLQDSTMTLDGKMNVLSPPEDEDEPAGENWLELLSDIESNTKAPLDEENRAARGVAILLRSCETYLTYLETKKNTAQSPQGKHFWQVKINAVNQLQNTLKDPPGEPTTTRRKLTAADKLLKSHSLKIIEQSDTRGEAFLKGIQLLLNLFLGAKNAPKIWSSEWSRQNSAATTLFVTQKKPATLPNDKTKEEDQSQSNTPRF